MRGELKENKVLIESYHKISSILAETFGPNFVLFTVLLTTASSIIYFIALSYIITQMDSRYFLRRDKGGEAALNSILKTPVQKSIAFVINAAKLMVGFCLLLCGLAMLVLPGQGLVTILIALGFLPFPGKHKLEQNLLARKSVRSSLNWIRVKAHKVPFVFDEDA